MILVSVIVSGAADAADDTRIRNIMRAAVAKATEDDLLLYSIRSTPFLPFIFHIKNVNN